jgi:hypothetical protein
LHACCALPKYLKCKYMCACIGPGDSPAQSSHVSTIFQISCISGNDDVYVPSVLEIAGYLVFLFLFVFCNGGGHPRRNHKELATWRVLGAPSPSPLAFWAQGTSRVIQETSGSSRGPPCWVSTCPGFGPQSRSRKRDAKTNVCEICFSVRPMDMYPCGRGNSAISDA